MNELSVFMPCYNVEKYVEDAIRSVLYQTYSEFELIIVDDGSTDKTLEILKRFERLDSRIKIYVNEKNMGVAYTRNLMFDLCNSEYIAIMDSDDIMSRDRLEIEKTYMDLNPQVVAVGGAMQIITEDGKFENSVGFTSNNWGANMARLLFDNPFLNSSMMIRKSVFNQRKIRYDLRFNAIEDYKFWAESIFEGKIVNLNRIMFFYRKRENSLSATSSARFEKTSELYDLIHKEYLQCLCANCLSSKEINFYLREAKRIVLGDKENNIIERIHNSVKLQKILVKICNNCSFADDDFKLEIINMIKMHSSQTVYKILKKLKLLRFNDGFQM
ncbi:Glycosyl transferase family 2 [Lachnospiraceae bacterium KH1T2]|nr:Glycosyl transferase family 2 [Lachnospiraceae bacterium KH1T2]